MSTASKPVRASRRREQPHGPLPGAVVIARSVGAGGANVAADVLGVQVALNAVPSSLSGASDALALDGRMGPKTQGAIHAFQQRWTRVVDSRCDPAGPTLRLLNRMAGVGDVVPPGVAPASSIVVGAGAGSSSKSPTVGQQAAIAAAELRHMIVHRAWMPLVSRWLVATLRLTSAAQRYADALLAAGPKPVAPPGGAADAPDRRAFLFVAKHFRLHEAEPAPAAAACARVDTMLRRAMVVARQVREHPPPQLPNLAAPGEPLVFVCLWGRPLHVKADTLGYATAGGLWSTPGENSGWINPYETPPPLRWRAEARGQIFLPPLFDTVSPNKQRMVLVHELIHALGPSHGQSHPILDPAYVHEGAKYAKLTRQQRLDNADTYAVLVVEAMLGTLDGLSAAGSNSATISAHPMVDPGVIWNLDPQPRLPPASHPDAAGLVFPGGFH